MKTINLYFDFEFTSLSPDAQPISLGIVSDDMIPRDFPNEYPKDELISYTDYKRKTFYAEFSDFDINRCDDWVEKNVVEKLQIFEGPNLLGMSNENALKLMNNGIGMTCGDDNKSVIACTELIKNQLKEWLEQFSDYQIQFVADCGTYDWYWLVQLLAEWEDGMICRINKFDKEGEEISYVVNMKNGFTHDVFMRKKEYATERGNTVRIGRRFQTGLPKLPDNISPVPEDLNDLIARNKGISIREAFDLSRLELIEDWERLEHLGMTGKVFNLDQFPKHNALFDAKVIKEIYQKLK